MFDNNRIQENHDSNIKYFKINLSVSVPCSFKSDISLIITELNF